MKTSKYLKIGVLLFFGFIYDQTQAQFSLEASLNLQSSMNFTTYSNDTLASSFGSTTPNIGVSAGIDLGYTFSQKSALFLGLRYEQFGYTQFLPLSNKLFWFYRHTVSLPLDFRYRFSPKIEGNIGLAANIGPSVSNPLMATMTIPYFGAYGQIGLSWLFADKWSFLVHYKCFFTPYFTYAFDDAQFGGIVVRRYFQAINLGLAYRFLDF